MTWLTNRHNWCSLTKQKLDGFICWFLSSLLLTCCDDFDTDELLEAEFNKFCLAKPFVVSALVGIDVVGLIELFLLKFSNIDAISGDMFCVDLLPPIVSGNGNSDIWKYEKDKNFRKAKKKQKRVSGKSDALGRG